MSDTDEDKNVIKLKLNNKKRRREGSPEPPRRSNWISARHIVFSSSSESTSSSGVDSESNDSSEFPLGIDPSVIVSISDSNGTEQSSRTEETETEEGETNGSDLDSDDDPTPSGSSSNRNQDTSDSVSPYREGSAEPDDDLVDDVVLELSYEPWFLALSRKEQNKYVDKMLKLKSPCPGLVSMKDILDMDIPESDMKTLLTARRRLDSYDRLSEGYSNECSKFMKKLTLLNKPADPRVEAFKNAIQNDIKTSVDLETRILHHPCSDEVKKIMYDKYTRMQDSYSDEASKIRVWIETALSLPLKPKQFCLPDVSEMYDPEHPTKPEDVVTDRRETHPNEIESVPIVDGTPVEPCSTMKDLGRSQTISKMLSELMKQLNTKIYGMQEAKEELICMLASMYSGTSKSKHKAIGLCGPPGIGKTMIVEILSIVLGVPMGKIALGGITDASYLEGHGFTYIGSEAGMIVKTLIKLGCTNGILFFDEIDKVSRTDRGREIEHSLLHITDFTQNHDYRDKYLSEIPIDLSDHIFVYSMNSVRGMDPTLISRMPIVRFEGYNVGEKTSIVTRYMIPDLLNNFGIRIGDVIVPLECVRYLISHIKEEEEINGKSGVRGIKKALTRILLRVNLYRLASVDGKMDMQLSFVIKDFKLPYVLTLDVVEKIVKENKGDMDSGVRRMYC